MKQLSHFTFSPPQAWWWKELFSHEGASFLLDNPQMDFTQLDWRPQEKKTTGNWKDVEINIAQRNLYIVTE